MKTIAWMLVPLIVLLAGGCGSTTPGEETPPVPTVVQPPPQKPAFETRTDTVDAVHRAAKLTKKSAGGREPQIRFMVQIGAFKDGQFASQRQALARSRYHMPVLNDYNAKHRLYQIRIGFFESREAARAFRLRMIREHPGEYGDAWVVQLKR